MKHEMTKDRDHIYRHLCGCGIPPVLAELMAVRWKSICLPWQRNSVSMWLAAAFFWSGTPEGCDFWHGVYEDLKERECDDRL